MNQVYLWTVEYKVSNATKWDRLRKINVITRINSYAIAEYEALKAIKYELKDSDFSFNNIINIRSSVTVYTDDLTKETEMDKFNRLVDEMMYSMVGSN